MRLDLLERSDQAAYRLDVVQIERDVADLYAAEWPPAPGVVVGRGDIELSLGLDVNADVSPGLVLFQDRHAYHPAS